ncbi:MAG: flippase [Tannerellaceae bacterium]|jgi:O-antigen/teichoic acid export membrane protein|nr:flippase [Tannerellaceae bacterium]
MSTHSSLKRNYLYNLLNVGGGLIFPLFSFPYASRILMADGLGLVSFYQSIIAYIALAAAIGIPLYAVREVARVRDDPRQAAIVTLEVSILHGSTTLIAYLLVIALTLFLPRISHPHLFLLISSMLALQVIGAGWFFQAMEDFKYVTIRVSILRVFLLAGLFLFVKSKDDLIFYSLIHVLGEMGASFFNLFRLRTYFKGIRLTLTDLHPLRHLRPALNIFALNVVISIYVNLDSVMLGFINDDAAVGFYSPALRLTKTAIGIVSALGAVLLPRFSNMISNNQTQAFNELASKAIAFVFFLSLPMMVGLIALAPAAILLFSGSNYQPSILTLQLLAPIIPAISLSGIIGMQILYAQGKEHIVLRATTAGALINLTLNLLLMPHFAQWGAAASTSIAEITVTLLCIFLGRPYFSFAFRHTSTLNYFTATALLIPYLLLLSHLISNPLTLILTAIPSSTLLYAAFLFLRRDRFILQILSLCRNYCTNEKRSDSP